MRVLAPFLALAVSQFALVCSAAEFRSGEDIVIKADETIDDDLYVFGRSIVIDGTVDGDVIAWAQEITINGSIKGSLIAAGQTIVLSGDAYNARLGGQVIKLGAKAKVEG